MKLLRLLHHKLGVQQIRLAMDWQTKVSVHCLRFSPFISYPDLPENVTTNSIGRLTPVNHWDRSLTVVCHKSAPDGPAQRRIFACYINNVLRSLFDMSCQSVLTFSIPPKQSLKLSGKNDLPTHIRCYYSAISYAQTNKCLLPRVIAT
jgi:hypothetical protein